MLWAVLRSEIPSGMCAKLRTAAVSNNRHHASLSLLLLLAHTTCIMVLFFTHIPFVMNHTINATPPERLQQQHLETAWSWKFNETIGFAGQMPHVHARRWACLWCWLVDVMLAVLKKLLVSLQEKWVENSSQLERQQVDEQHLFPWLLSLQRRVQTPTQYLVRSCFLLWTVDCPRLEERCRRTTW